MRQPSDVEPDPRWVAAGPALAAAARAAPTLGLDLHRHVRVVGAAAELRVSPVGDGVRDPVGRTRALAGGMALRGLEDAVSALLGPAVAVVTAEPRRASVVAERDSSGPLATVTGDAAAGSVSAARGGATVQRVTGARLRIVACVLATAAGRRRGPEPPLRHVQPWADDAAGLAARLDRGELLLVTTHADDGAAWLAAGRAAQRAVLAATAGGARAVVLGDALDAPGVRAALAHRLGTDGWPQLVVHREPAAGPVAPRAEVVAAGWRGPLR